MAAALHCAHAVHLVIMAAAHLSSDALSSSTASLRLLPSSCRATASMLVVLPVPGGPCSSKHMQQHASSKTQPPLTI
jgi:hypothetical protein